jgi:hypothetical protein
MENLTRTEDTMVFERDDQLSGCWVSGAFFNRSRSRRRFRVDASRWFPESPDLPGCRAGRQAIIKDR